MLKLSVRCLILHYREAVGGIYTESIWKSHSKARFSIFNIYIVKWYIPYCHILMFYFTVNASTVYERVKGSHFPYHLSTES